MQAHDGAMRAMESRYGSNSMALSRGGRLVGNDALNGNSGNARLRDSKSMLR
jgi:hypothetical protein